MFNEMLLKRGVSLVTALSMSVPAMMLGAYAQSAAADTEVPYCDTVHFDQDVIKRAETYFATYHVAPHVKGKVYSRAVRCMDRQNYKAMKVLSFKVATNPENGKMSLAETATVIKLANQDAWYSNYWLDGGIALATVTSLVLFHRIRKGRAEAREEKVRAREAKAREEGAALARSAGLTNAPRSVNAQDLGIPNAKNQNMSVVGAIPQSQVPAGAATFTSGGNTYITQVNPNSDLLELIMINNMISHSMFWDPYYMYHPWYPTMYSSPFIYDPYGVAIIDPGYSAPVVYNETIYENTTPVVQDQTFVADTAAAVDVGGTVESQTTTFLPDTAADTTVASADKAPDFVAQNDDVVAQNDQPVQQDSYQAPEPQPDPVQFDSTPDFSVDTSSVDTSSSSPDFSSIGTLVGTGALAGAAAYGTSQTKAEAAPAKRAH